GELGAGKFDRRSERAMPKENRVNDLYPVQRLRERLAHARIVGRRNLRVEPYFRCRCHYGPFVNDYSGYDLQRLDVHWIDTERRELSCPEGRLARRGIPDERDGHLIRIGLLFDEVVRVANVTLHRTGHIVLQHPGGGTDNWRLFEIAPGLNRFPRDDLV